jgi:hypothetical protein
MDGTNQRENMEMKRIKGPSNCNFECDNISCAIYEEIIIHPTLTLQFREEM